MHHVAWQRLRAGASENIVPLPLLYFHSPLDSDFTRVVHVPGPAPFCHGLVPIHFSSPDDNPAVVVTLPFFQTRRDESTYPLGFSPL